MILHKNIMESELLDELFTNPTSSLSLLNGYDQSELIKILYIATTTQLEQCQDDDRSLEDAYFDQAQEQFEEELIEELDRGEINPEMTFEQFLNHFFDQKWSSQSYSNLVSLRLNLWPGRTKLIRADLSQVYGSCFIDARLLYRHRQIIDQLVIMLRPICLKDDYHLFGEERLGSIRMWLSRTFRQYNKLITIERFEAIQIMKSFNNMFDRFLPTEDRYPTLIYLQRQLDSLNPAQPTSSHPKIKVTMKLTKRI